MSDTIRLQMPTVKELREVRKVIAYCDCFEQEFEPVRSHWIPIDSDLDVYECSECGEIFQIQCIPIWEYCPRCGSRNGRRTDEHTD